MKKLLIILSTLILTLSSFASNITGPRVKVSGNIGMPSALLYFPGLGIGASVQPEWNKKINNDVSISFGPVLALDLHFTNLIGIFFSQNINVGFATDINYKLKNDNQLYSGILLGSGLKLIELKLDDFDVTPYYGRMFNFRIGVKNKDYFYGAFIGYGDKGYLGFESGYTFK